MARRRRTPTTEWVMAAAMWTLTGSLFGISLWVQPSVAPVSSDASDPRRPIETTHAQRTAVLWVMRENVRSIHQMLAAQAQGEPKRVAALAAAASDARNDQRARDAFPDGAPRLWSELGRQADTRLVGLADPPMTTSTELWAGLGHAMEACVDCHVRYRLE